VNKHDSNNTKPNFGSILDEAPTEVNRPKSLPTGTYTFVVGRWEEGKSSQKKTPFVKFGMRPIAAGDDVDPDELQEALTSADGTVADLGSKMMSITFYCTPDAIYRLDEFHEHCGLDLDEAVSRKMRNDEVANAQVEGYVAPRQQTDPDAPTYSEIKRTLPAE
jgi:hypothetical protein